MLDSLVIYRSICVCGGKITQLSEIFSVINSVDMFIVSRKYLHAHYIIFPQFIFYIPIPNRVYTYIMYYENV